MSKSKMNSDKWFDDDLSDDILKIAVDSVGKRSKENKPSFAEYQMVYDHFMIWLEKNSFPVFNGIIVFAYFNEHKMTWNSDLIRTKYSIY